MLRRWRQWLALPHADRMTTMAMAVALPAISLGLSLFGYVRMRRWIERMTSHADVRPASHDDIVQGQRLARLAAIAGAHGPIKASCLRQSLLVHALLRKEGLDPELKLGVSKPGPHGLMAHAWIELAGHSLDHPAQPTHSPFSRP